RVESTADSVADSFGHVTCYVNSRIDGITGGVCHGFRRIGNETTGVLREIDNAARVNGELEAKGPTDPQGRPETRTNVKLPILAHTELGVGFGTNTGACSYFHTALDTADLGPDIGAHLTTRERTGIRVDTGSTS